MHATFDHVHVYAEAPEESMAFYQRHFGAERLGALPNAHGSQNHFLLLGTQVLVFSTYPPGMSPKADPVPGDGALDRGGGVAHFGLHVTDLQAKMRSLAEVGVALHHPEPLGTGKVRYAYFTGPDGVVIELTEYRLKRRLQPVMFAVGLVNLAIHRTRRRLVRTFLAS